MQLSREKRFLIMSIQHELPTCGMLMRAYTGYDEEAKDVAMEISE
jgi:hypothetical protein